MDEEAGSESRPTGVKKALDWLQSQLAQRPEDSGLWYSKGVILVKSGELEEALKAFDKAMWLDPKHHKALEAKARTLFKLERFLEAYDVYKKLAKEVPKDEEYWYYCGEALVQLGSYSKALPYYYKALDVNPYYADAWYGKANVLEGVARERTAKSDIGRGSARGASREPDPTLEEILTRAESAHYDEDYERALKLYDEVLATNEMESRAWEGKGMVLTRLSRFSEAAECYERAIKAKPEETGTWLARGRTLREGGDTEEALRSFEEALRADPHNVEAAVEMREVKSQAGNGEGEEDPRDVNWILERTGEEEEAQEVPSRAAQAPTFSTYLDLLDGTMDGGVTRGTVTLVTGMPGTFKTSLCFWILYQQAIKEGRKSLYISIEQSKKSLLRQVISMGLDPAAVAADLRILDLSRYRRNFRPKGSRQQWLTVLKRKVEEVREEGAEALVIDSLGALESMAAFKDRRRDIFRLFDLLRSLEMTSFVIAERYELHHQGKMLKAYDVADFLADGIMELTLKERESGDPRRALRLTKMRDRKHATSLYYLDYSEKGCALEYAYS